jgi:hypothetical protein
MAPLDLVKLQLLDALATVSANPNLTALPGGAAAQKLVNGISAFGLLACVGVVIWGAAQWGFGSHSSNYSHSGDGKTRMLKGVGGAFAIGAAAALINFFFDAGTTVR